MALKINVPVVKGEASAINGYVAEYKKEIGKIYLTIAELKQGWEGEANSTYTKKTDDCTQARQERPSWEWPHRVCARATTAV